MNYYVRLATADGTELVEPHSRAAIPKPGEEINIAGVAYLIGPTPPVARIERVETDAGRAGAVEVFTVAVASSRSVPLAPHTDPSLPPKPIKLRATKLNRKRRSKVTPQPPANAETAAPAAETPAPAAPQPQPDAPMRVADLPADAVVARFRDAKSRDWIGPIIALRRTLRVGEAVELLGGAYGVAAIDGGTMVEWGGRRFDLKTVWVAPQRLPAKQPSFVYP